MKHTLTFASAALLLVAALTLSGAANSRAAQSTAAATTAATRRATTAATARATAQPTRAATSRPTLAATARATRAAPVAPTLEPTAEATDESSVQPLTFTQAPAPDAGTIGVSLSGDSSVIIRALTADGPAEKAGVQPGDEVTAVNGTPVSTREALIAAIVATKSGETLTLTVLRDGQEQKIDVVTKTRREVYCPVPEAALTEGDALISNAFASANNVTITGDSTSGVAKSVKGGVLGFTNSNPETAWQAVGILRSSPALAYSFSVDIEQVGSTYAGIILNLSQTGDYLFELAPNGSWNVSATVGGDPSGGGISFTEPSLNATTSTGGTIKNTIKIVTDGNDMFFYFNGTFACGVPLYTFVDPPLDEGSFGFLVIADADATGKTTVNFSNLKIADVPTK